MKNLFILSIINCMAFAAHSADLEFNGDQDSFCTINVTQQGGIIFSNEGTHIHSGGVNAKATVTNNDPGQYSLSVLQPTDFSISPSSYDNSNLALSVNLTVPAGQPNPAIEQTTIPLVSQGTDNVYIRLHGSNGSTPFSAGNYQVMSILSCELS